MSTGNKYKIKQLINCNTRFVVYIITCVSCGIQYVGRTRKFSVRLRDHLKNIQWKRQMNLRKHLSKYSWAKILAL